MNGSLWGAEFNVDASTNTKKLLKKIAEPKEPTTSVEKQIKSKKLSLQEKLVIIKENVLKILGKYKDDTLTITTERELIDYIDKAIANNFISVDTETDNSLDPLTCKLMGLCLHTYGMKQAYIPVNHVNRETGKRLENQLTEEFIREQLERIVKTNTKTVFHNAKFDYEVIKCTTGVSLNIHWDTLVGSKMIDENRRSHGLKQLYVELIDPSDEKYNIEHLFQGIEYALVDPELFALYAATDAYKTTKLHDYQVKWFETCEHKDLFKLFTTVELPIIAVTAEMELYGITLDTEYGGRLSDKYHKLLDTIDNETSEELKKLQPKIDEWKKSTKGQQMVGKKTKADQLTDPVNLSSPTQLAIILYDILEITPPDKKNPRGTGEDVLEKINIPLCKAILKRRGMLKLVNTYIDKLPTILNPKTGRLHAGFNPLGAATGRFSSSEPNLQNIPSHNKEIRMMFRATPGYKLVGSDFSQAEPRLMAWYAQDENMINAYKNKKDLYATIASIVYNNAYEENLEFFPDGSPNPHGKERRSFMKSVILGLLYGRGTASVAEQIGKSIEEAQEIIDKFFAGFPNVKKWIHETQENCRKTGYVTDLWGRVRRLPDIQKPKYTIRLSKDSNVDMLMFNPLLGCADKENSEAVSLINKYTKATDRIKSKNDYLQLKQDALKDNIEIHDNSGFISQAERQCVNARVQGGSATCTKKAMIAVHNDPIMKQLGFHLMLCVHDELIGECPEENAQAVAERLSELMINAPKPECLVPFKCDADITSRWYEVDYAELIKIDYHKLNENLEDLYKLHSESTVEEINAIVKNA